MKTITAIAGGLLGLAFIVFGLNFFMNFIPMGDGPPAGSPPALFFGAVGPTGFMAFVKVCEILGGVLVAIPKTRNIGLLILGPIILNILAFHVFIGSPASLLDPPVIAISVLAAFLLISAKEKFLNLLN